VQLWGFAGNGYCASRPPSGQVVGSAPQPPRTGALIELARSGRFGRRKLRAWRGTAVAVVWHAGWSSHLACCCHRPPLLHAPPPSWHPLACKLDPAALFGHSPCSLTFWEQIDDGVQGTATRKFFTVVPVRLLHAGGCAGSSGCLLSAHESPALHQCQSPPMLDPTKQKDAVRPLVS